MEKLTEINTFQVRKTTVYSYFFIRLRLRYKGTVVNRALPSLHGGSLEITLTVPLIHCLEITPQQIQTLGVLKVKK